MNQCEVCGNEYDKPLEIVTNGISHYFDCFECAIHSLAPDGYSESEIETLVQVITDQIMATV